MNNNYLDSKTIKKLYNNIKNADLKIRRCPYVVTRTWETKNKKTAILVFSKINLYHKDYVQHVLGGTNEKQEITK